MSEFSLFIIIFLTGLVFLVFFSFIIGRIGLWNFFKTLVYAVKRVPHITLRSIHVNKDLVDGAKKGWDYANCPDIIYVKRKANLTLEVELGDAMVGKEPHWWYCYRCVDFCVGLHTGRINRMVIKYDHLKKRGQWFRFGMSIEWSKYLTSVVLAHIEVLKFSQEWRSHQPTLISRIFKEYADNIFQEIV